MFVVIAWLNSEHLNEAAAHATSHLPQETGGVLLGYWHSSREVVVTCMTHAGPAAIHKRRSYTPDYEFDEQWVARAYKDSRGTTVYLGDWHSHPQTETPYLSSKDKRALRRIACSDLARAPTPLSLVLAGERTWTAAIWRAELSSGRLWRRLLIEPCEVFPYD